MLSSRTRRVALAAAVAVAALAGAQSVMAAAVGPLAITALSNRADLVSGNDVLLRVDVPSDAQPSDVRVDVAGRDVTGDFALRPDGSFAGLVAGLAVGPNLVTARLADGRAASLTVTNHPVGGPIFSGPQITPWFCLPGALDAQCNRPTVYTWHYKSSTTGSFEEYDPESPPSDVATTTTDEGETVPYVVRVETGNADRSQYRIAVLADPAAPFDRWSRPAAWNGKVYVPHGAGCGMGHSEGAAPDVLLDLALSRGHSVMSTALEHNTENCNLVVQAESVMMAKERLLEQYGDIRYVMGTGCSGGSIAQLHMANAYPGLYDGLTVGCTYPDIPVNDLLDCPALLDYWDDPTRWAPGVVWTEPQQAAAAGLASTSVCRSWTEAPVLDFSTMFDPTVGVACDVPDQAPETVYDPETNPAGVRCSYQDYLVNILGTRPADRWGPVEQQIGRGFANRPYDNVGLQYGLRALQSGEITPAMFVDLNTKVGSRDIDYQAQPQRVEADPAAIAAVYRSGTLNEANNLDRVPIIDMPIPGDRYEIHDNYKSWGLRERLRNANGHHDNHVIWYGPDEAGGTPTGLQQYPPAFVLMDEWLSAITADTSATPVEQKVVAHKPGAAVDRCDLPDRPTCDLVFGPAGNIRLAAGGSLANDVVKCQLAPLSRDAYAPAVLTDAQWEALQQAFPAGVCDWTRPGVDQQPAVAWQTYASGTGQPLADPPASVAFRGLSPAEPASGQQAPAAAAPAAARAVPAQPSLAATGGSELLAAAAALLLGSAVLVRRRLGRSGPG